MQSRQYGLVLWPLLLPEVTLKHGSPKLSVELGQKIHLFLTSRKDNTYWE